MPFEFCLIPNRALDSIVVLCRDHTYSLILSSVIGCHPPSFQWPNCSIVFCLQCTCFCLLLLLFFHFCFIGSFFCYIRVERTLFLCGLSRIYLYELFGVNFHGENKPTCHLNDEVRARETTCMPQQSQREYEVIFLFFSIYCLFLLLSIMKGKTPPTAQISVAKTLFLQCWQAELDPTKHNCHKIFT